MILLVKSSRSKYVAPETTQTPSNSFLYKCFKLSVSLKKIIWRYLVNDPQALQGNSDCLKCFSGINLSPKNKRF